MKRVLAFLVAFIFVAAIPFVGGAVKEAEPVYFSITYNYDGMERVIAVTDKAIAPKWYFAESKQQFTSGKNLYERAAAIPPRELRNSEKAIRQHFPELHHIIERIAIETHKPKVDPTIHFNPDRVAPGGSIGVSSDISSKFFITGGANGRELDTHQLCDDILELLLNNEQKNINAIVNDIKIKTEQQILSQIVQRSTFSTNFEDNAGRECNIALALEAFDGVTVAPNETISFNDIVGRRTEARGYQVAKIIVDGEFVPGIGGGVCQASTTIFNSALLAGMKIVESHNHSLPISYVSVGRDAMVSSSADLRLHNPTDTPLYIEAKVIDKGRINTAVVTIYGRPTTKKYKPRVEVQYGEQEEELRGETPAQMLGFDFDTGEFWAYEKKVVSKGYPPRRAQTYVDVYDKGELVSSKLVRRSSYKGKERVVEWERVTKSG